MAISNSVPATPTGARWQLWNTYVTDVSPSGVHLPGGEHRYVAIDEYERTLRPELLTEYAQLGYCWVVIGSLQAGRSFAQPAIARRLREGPEPGFPPGVRDALQAYLTDHGVGTNIHYPTPVHLQPCFKGRWAAGDFPVAEALSASLLSLPLDPMHTEREIDFVIARIRDFFSR